MCVSQKHKVWCLTEINIKSKRNKVARPPTGLKLCEVKAMPLRNALEASPPPLGPWGAQGPKNGLGPEPYGPLLPLRDMREAQFTLVNFNSAV